MYTYPLHRILCSLTVPAQESRLSGSMAIYMLVFTHRLLPQRRNKYFLPIRTLKSAQNQWLDLQFYTSVLVFRGVRAEVVCRTATPS